MNISSIPTDHYLPARELIKLPLIDYSNLKKASKPGGVLRRWKSPKTGRVYYKSLNLRLF